MYCPLCKAEYRDGFTECSDCHIALVATQEEALQAKVSSLWSGDEQHEYDRIFAALNDAGIHYHGDESVEAKPHILGFGVRPHVSTFHYQVWVFEGDLKRAEIAIYAPDSADEVD
jgi:hypothetical protein